MGSFIFFDKCDFEVLLCLVISVSMLVNMCNTRNTQNLYLHKMYKDQRSASITIKILCPCSNGNSLKKLQKQLCYF